MLVASHAEAHRLELVGAHAHPTWDGCCSRISDPICETENVACLVLKEPIKLALRGAEELVDASRHTLEVAKAAFAVSEGALIAAEQGVVAAQTTVDGVEAAYSVGLKTAEFIAKLGINGLISIRKISFDVSLITLLLVGHSLAQ